VSSGLSCTSLEASFAVQIDAERAEIPQRFDLVNTSAWRRLEFFIPLKLKLETKVETRNPESENLSGAV
jgi:hypothetical protein